jgi:hypothetical protein
MKGWIDTVFDIIRKLFCAHCEECKKITEEQKKELAALRERLFRVITEHAPHKVVKSRGGKK